MELKKKISGLQIRARRWQINQRVFRLARHIARRAPIRAGQQPVIFFNASTRLVGISQNAAFAMLAACGLQLAGVPVIYFACNAGMSRCVLGTDRDDPAKAPPCASCTRQAGWLFAHAPTVPFRKQNDPQLNKRLNVLDLAGLKSYVHPEENLGPNPFPAGELVLPSLRWALRRHHLPEHEDICSLYREYILSAVGVARQFAELVDQVEPQSIVLFNGMFFPEATARWVAQQRGIRVITHEVGFRPLTAYFTSGEATAYPIDIPNDFELTEEQNARLDAYLEKRFQGKFSMAGIQFWPEMRGLEPAFLEQAKQYQQIVPVFTNVVFDTSQVHANRIFEHMFAWLDLVLEIIRSHPETLFIIRAHPDEMRPGKESRESVRQWVESRQVKSLPNVVFVDSQEYISSYELISKAKFVMVYNSTIGLEASILGAPVLCGGKARFTQLSTVFLPATPEDYRQQAEQFLDGERIEVPADFRRNARRFLYYQVYRTSLPFQEYLEPDGIWPGFVRLKPFSWQKLKPENSPAIRAIVDGVLHGGSFYLEEAVKE